MWLPATVTPGSISKPMESTSPNSKSPLPTPDGVIGMFHFTKGGMLAATLLILNYIFPGLMNGYSSEHYPPKRNVIESGLQHYIS